MSKQATSLDTDSAISSPASPDGRSPCKWPDGPLKPKSGPGHVPVSRFRAQDSEKAMPIDDTCGPLFTASSPSADLQRSLANKLRQRMAGNGSPLYELTWSEWDMPAGVPICRLRASAHRTSDNGFGGWRTQDTGMGSAIKPERYQEWVKKGGQVRLSTQAMLAGWPHSERRTAKRYRYEVEGAAGEDKGGEEKRQRVRDDLGDGCSVDGLADSHESRRYSRNRDTQDGHEDCRRGERSRGGLGSCCEDNGMGNPTSAERTRQRSVSVPVESEQETGRSGYANPWAGSRFIQCADGKARPFEPGIFPLADGIPGRVGRLRAYGNAIVPAVAAEFIKAYMDIT